MRLRNAMVQNNSSSISSLMTYKPLLRLRRALSTQHAQQTSSHIPNENAVVFERLSRAYEIFEPKSPSYRYKVPQCISYYNKEKATFLEDIFKYPKINENLYHLIWANFWESSSIRSLVIRDLKNLWMKEKYDVVSRILDDLQSRLSIHLYTKGESREDLANKIIIFATLSGEPLIGCLLLCTSVNSKVHMQPKTIEIVVRCMTGYKGNLYHHYNYALLKLINTIGVEALTISEISKILSFTLLWKNDAYFANLIFERIKKRIPEDVDGSMHETLRQLIFRNIEASQSMRAFKIWKDLTHIDSIKNDPSIYSQFIKHLEDPSELFAIKPPSYERKYLDTLLEYFGTSDKTTPEFQIALSKIRPPVQRHTLSILLKCFLLQDKDGESERILLSILKSPIGLTTDDFNQIITKLLRKGDIDQAIQMTVESDPSISSKSYISVFQNLLNRSDKDRMASFVPLMTNYLKRNKPETSPILPMVVDFISSQHQFEGRAFLASVLKNLKIYKTWNDVGRLPDLRKYSLDNCIYDVMDLSVKSVTDSLLILLDRAVSHDQIELVKYCIVELRQCGHLLTDILSRIQQRDEKFLSKYFQNVERYFL